MIWLALLACDEPEPIVGWADGPCLDAGAELGKLPCVHDVPDLDHWVDISVTADAVDQTRASKWMVPATDDGIPPLVLNAQEYELHSDMLAEAFADLYPGLQHADYVRMVLDDPPVYYSGNLARYIEPGGGLVFGFTIWDDPADPATTITLDEAQFVYAELLDMVALRPLVFVASSSNQRDAVQTWNGEMPFRSTDSVSYEPYTRGVGYGTLTLIDLDELDAAEFGWQDIVVLDEAPLDIERVVSGVVTGTRQATLSHLNVRSSARGTPNCYLDGAQPQLQAWEGKIVRLCCGADGIEIEEATQADAEAWWEAIRPEPVDVVQPDYDTNDLMGLHDLPTDDTSARRAGVAAYGSKGTNLATLYQRIDPELQLDGFLVPMSFSLSEPDNAEIVQEIHDQIVMTFGDDAVMVRFRSSSNAEDALGFSGAGLYDSESVCAADSFDDDEVGPSLCDPDQADEKTIEAGLEAVWSSLWNERAVEERAWYGIDEADVAMAILVNTRSKDEEANIVAFTGVPGYPSDNRLFVEAQVGRLDVVSNESGTWPERSLLEMDDGEVVHIERAQSSSEQDIVLDDARLHELGAALWDIEDVYPVDGESDGRVLLDTEWKVLSDGRLVVKQVRPFSD